MTIKEYKTHFADTRLCEVLGEDIIIEQMKASGSIIVQCRNAAGFVKCYADYLNPTDCPLSHDKLIEKIS